MLVTPLETTYGEPVPPFSSAGKKRTWTRERLGMAVPKLMMERRMGAKEAMTRGKRRKRRERVMVVERGFETKDVMDTVPQMPSKEMMMM
jgi:hypothetical protein